MAQLEGLIEGFGLFRPAEPAATAGDHGRGGPFWRACTISECYAAHMSPELIGIVGVGVTVAGLILTGKRDTDRRIDALAARMSGVEQTDGRDGATDGSHGGVAGGAWA